MHNEPNSRLPGEGQHATQGAETLDSAALARRRALIKGLGKGGAALAVVAPIQSYAVPKLNTGQVCSLSGLQSGVTSHTPTNGLTCTGWPPTHFTEGKFQMAFDWPAGINADTATFMEIFDGTDARRLIDILRLLASSGTATPPSAADVDKAYWIAAYFNSQIAGNNWLYTKEQVVSQYNSADATNYLVFYKTYLSGRV